jgi:hypothetical protein
MYKYVYIYEMNFTELTNDAAAGWVFGRGK